MRNANLVVSIGSLFCLLATQAAPAALQWSEYGGGHAMSGGHAAHNPRAVRGVRLEDSAGATVEIVLPTLEHKPLTLTEGKVALRPTGFDNYHLLLATRQGEGGHETALRYQYMNGRPSGHSPAELVNAEKAPLEIVPMPLAREHARYLGEREATFLVRYQGAPLAEQPISLETSNGTRVYTRTDTDGRVSFVLPNDFPEVNPGRANNAPADFALRTSYDDNGRLYRTSLSAGYFANPRHWQSFKLGVWAGLGGFVFGLGLLRITSRKTPAAAARA